VSRVADRAGRERPNFRPSNSDLRWAIDRPASTDGTDRLKAVWKFGQWSCTMIDDQVARNERRMHETSIGRGGSLTDSAGRVTVIKRRGRAS